jgi:uncharacterized protein affecting Mg2+/Co2+ transport
MSRKSDADLLARTLYRALLGVPRAIGTGKLRIRLPVDQSPNQWGRGSQQFGFVPARSAAEQVFPSAEPSDELNAPEHSADTLRTLIRHEFRRALTRDDALDLGLDALKQLHAQMAMAERSSCVCTKHDETGAAVCIEATSHYVGRDGPLFVFQYRIRVSNVGAIPVQVVSRGWDMRNQDGSSQAVVARGSPGVVGQTPRLQPGGDAFEYASGTAFATPGGSIQGSLQIVSLGREDGNEAATFDAEVGLFNCLMEDART